ncbi:uncharacterized protein RHOBADRAFT_66557 [Rhodotorula graminis WP1]|uniref:Uncharacterized protein n=1 Tax=Rhodotorula graminis (strain WP1) TaxID=578459 RepID=A0A194S0S9_RHOGW|nr:uncharacterized protein RHOBADRAFT_66557 [Rhodotorula graminis WP1]KPV74212.1 hypothetical protein RHOBADRAFT_66557 [Rhodotorula graminis WP1]
MPRRRAIQLNSDLAIAIASFNKPGSRPLARAGWLDRIITRRRRPLAGEPRAVVLA